MELVPEGYGINSIALRNHTQIQNPNISWSSQYHQSALGLQASHNAPGGTPQGWCGRCLIIIISITMIIVIIIVITVVLVIFFTSGSIGRRVR